MLATTSESRLRWIRALLAAGWVLLIVSLFVDPFTPWLTDPGNTASPIRLGLQQTEVQGRLLAEQPYSIGARLFWSVAVPIVPLFLMLAGHEAWRRICPLSFFSQLPRMFGIEPESARVDRRTGAVQRKLRLVGRDSWFGQQLWVLPFVLLCAGVTARLLFINGHGPALGIFFILVILTVLAIGLRWGGKTWCNYVCPLSVVQKIYTEPGGLLESKPHQQRNRTPQSMCRSPAAEGDRSTCVGCTPSCPDVDLEKSHWDHLEDHGRRFVTYGYFGMVIAFYTYFYLYAGNWDYYFNGAWSHEEDLLQQLGAPGFYLAGQTIAIPKWLAAPLTITVGVALGYLFWRTIERLYVGWRQRRDPQVDRRQLRHQLLITCAAVTINVFYFFGGRPNILLLPDLAQQLIDILVVVVSTLWWWRSLHRSRAAYNREAVAASLRKQLTDLGVGESAWLDGRHLDDLSADEVYILAKALPDVTRDQKRTSYKNVLREALEAGTADSASSLSLLAELRTQLDLTDDDHLSILQELGIEDRGLLDPDQARHREDRLRRQNYQEALAELTVRAIGEDGDATRALARPEVREEITALQRRFGIAEDEHREAWRLITANEDSVLVDQARTAFQAIVDPTIAIFVLDGVTDTEAAGDSLPGSTLQLVVGALRRQRDAAAERLLRLLVAIGDTDPAVRLAQDCYTLLGTELDTLLDRRPQQDDQPRSWRELVPDRLREALERKLTSGEMPGGALSGGGRSGNFSFARVIQDAGTPETVLQDLLRQPDPLLQALALEALAERDPALARERIPAEVDRHWLLREVRDQLTGTGSIALARRRSGGQQLDCSVSDRGRERRCTLAGAIRIGQHATNDLVIHHPLVSPHHAVVRPHGQRCTVQDLDSVHGTRVGDRLLHGDHHEAELPLVIRLGDSDLAPTVRLAGGAEAGGGYVLQEAHTIAKMLLLVGFDLFRSLRLGTLAAIARDAEVRRYDQGAVLCRSGDRPAAIWVLQRGAVTVTTHRDGTAQTSELAAPRLLGEVGFFADQPRTADLVIAADHSLVLALQGPALDDLLERDADASRQILRLMYQYIA